MKKKRLKKLVAAARKAVRRDDKLRAACVKLSAKLQSERRKTAAAREWIDELEALLKHNNQWVAASAMAAEHAALLAAARTRAVEERLDKANLVLRDAEQTVEPPARRFGNR